MTGYRVERQADGILAVLPGGELDLTATWLEAMRQAGWKKPA